MHVMPLRGYCSAALALVLATLAQGLAAQQPAGDLELGVPRTIQAGAGIPSTLGVAARAGEFVHIHLETAARVREAIVVDSRAQPVKTFSRVQGGRGVHILFSAPAADRYALRVTVEGPAPTFTAHLITRRAATSEDTFRLEGARLLQEGQRRAAETTAEGREAALELMSQSVRAWEAAHDLIGLGDTWNRIGQLHYARNEHVESAAAHERAATILDSGGDLRGKAEALGNAGVAYGVLGRQEKARELHTSALAVAIAAADRRAEGFALHNLGAVEYNLGNFGDAIAHYERSLELKREVGDVPSTAVTLSNLATTYSRIGEASRSIELRRDALRIHREGGNENGVAYALMGIGIALASRGELDDGLGHLDEALEIFTRHSDSRGRAYVLHNTAAVYAGADQIDRALRLYEEALPLRRAVGDPVTLGTTLLQLGRLHLQLGEHQKALAELGEALALKRGSKDRYGEAYAAGSMAMLQHHMGDRAKALELGNRALTLSRAVSDPLGEATALHNLGTILAGGGDASAALASLRQALDIRKRLRARAPEAETRLAIARIELDAGRFAEAARTLEPAIATIESLRGGVARPDLRVSFFAGHHDYFETMVDLLMLQHKKEPNAGHHRRALEFSERARARRLIDTVAEGRVDFRRGADPELIATEQRLAREVDATEAAIVRLLTAGNDSGVALVESRLRTQLQALEDLRVQIRLRDPRYAAIRFPDPPALADLQRQLDSNTAALEFMLGRERSYVWMLTREVVRSYELPAATDIDAQVRHLRELITARQDAATAPDIAESRRRVQRADQQHARVARELSHLLLGSIQVPAGIERLVIVADGVLETVPFALLDTAGSPSPAAALITRYELVRVPSLSTLTVLRTVGDPTPAGPFTVAVIADPVFSRDDPRFTTRVTSAPAPGAPAPASGVAPRAPISAYGRFERLRFSRVEAESISALLPERSVIALGFDADRATLGREPVRSAAVLHFATHAVLHPVHPELSGIVLSLLTRDGAAQDGFLRLNDIYNLDLSAGLVVLSACDTALGPDVKGEGLQGMARAFMYAGARRVVATLWQVDDRATAVLMDHFYTALVKEQKSPAAALRSAMQAMARDPRWSAPFYWAGFTLQGDW